MSLFPLRVLALLAFACAFEIASSPAAADAGVEPPASACTKSWGEARSTGLGYRHVVVVSNGCKRAVRCTVATDVAPEPQTVDVAPSASVEVVTFFESPASAFVPKVACAYRP
jgi:hypothetical protein